MARIAVIGAGIIGASAAIWLLADGHEVIVFDADPDGLPTSSGNAALIALPEVAPIAGPGILKTVPKWLLDPLGPLTVRWPDLPALTPWLAAFLMASRPSRAEAGRRALTGLMRTALADHVALQSKAEAGDHLRQSGYISLHDSEASLRAGMREAAAVKAALDFDFETLPPARARQLVPQLEGSFAGAIHQPAYRMVTNPLTMLRDYQRVVRVRGSLRQGRAIALEPQPGAVGVRLESGELAAFDRVVVAAGVWSRDLVRQLGLKVQLETERGYNTTFHDLGWNLPMPVGFADHGFVASPLVDGLRVGGAVELACPQSSPNFARARAMRQKMRRYVPALPEEGGREWMGRRPSTPDSLPVIALHPGDRRIAFAFGHGHLGLTLSAVTARLVAGLLTDGPTAALQSFDIQRFQ
ncbi:MAG: FAD-binding oxidoreductase [Devosia sp.]|nr:FAD-binding oxidoreductase [Devosia sp.]